MAEPQPPRDLRRQKPPPPAPAARPVAPAGGPRAPAGFLQPNAVIRPESMTPAERKEYDRLGFAPGTEVPGNFADVLQGIRDEAAANLPLPPDWKYEPDVHELGDLSPAEKARVHATVQAFAAQRDAQINAPRVPNAAPGVDAALAAAMAPTQPVRIVDDRPAVTRNSPSAPSAPQTPPEPEPATASPTGMGGAGYCPHCGWDQSKADWVEVTQDAKYGFLWSALGGPTRRFVRSYELLGGHLTVEFRSLTSAEAEVAVQQVAYDVRAGRVAGNADWLNRWMDYRMAFALAGITVAGVGKTYVGPADLAALAFDPPTDDDGKALPGTALPALRDLIEAEHLYNESVRRAVGLAYAQFVDLVKKLENNADMPDFWRGIAPPA